MANGEVPPRAREARKTVAIFVNIPPLAIAALDVRLGLVFGRVKWLNDFSATFPWVAVIKVRTSMAYPIYAVRQDFSDPIGIRVRAN